MGKQRDGHSAASEALGALVAQHRIHLLITDPTFLDLGVDERVAGWAAAAYDRCLMSILPYNTMRALQLAARDPAEQAEVRAQPAAHVAA